MDNNRFTVDDYHSVNELRNYVLTLERLLLQAYAELRKHECDYDHTTKAGLMEEIRTTVDTSEVYKERPM